MKITHTEIFKADLPLKEPFRIAVMELRHAANVFVRIHTDEGIYGLGESSPFAKITGETQAIDLAAAEAIAQLIKGREALELESRTAEIDGLIAHNTQIRAAFDMALHDLAGKAAGVPVYRLLGGSRRPMVTGLTIPIFSPAEMADKARAIVARGFQIIKVKLGAGADEDIQRMRAIRAAVGPDISLRIDANQGWDAASAIRVLSAIAPLGVEYCEQPVPYWDHAGLAEIRRRTSIPIMADESVFDHHDALRLAAADCCDYFNIKLAKAGGIRTASRVAAVASAAGKPCMVGCMLESRLGLAATVHFACAHANICFFDLDAPLLLASDPITGGFRYEGDTVVIDDAPGLGVDIDPAFLASLPRTTV